MSLQEKQELLRTKIVDEGHDPQKFYQFWQKYNIDLNEADIEIIAKIIEEFVTKQLNQNKEEENEDDDEFGEYVESTGMAPHSNFYDDINWDFLAEKPKAEHPITTHKIQEASPQKLIEISPEKLLQKQQPQSQKQITNTKQHPISQNQSVHMSDLLEHSQQKQITKDINNITFKEVLKNSETQKRKCLKLQPNILQHHVNVQINIIKFQEIQEENSGIINKLWKGTNLLFTIKTLGRNKQKAIGISWQVKRTHSDFQWLRTMLTRMYPGHVVPPLPSPTKDAKHMNGYQRKLQSFLVDCFRCPELRNSKYFQVFLSYSKQFENFKKNSENSSKPKDISHILNMNGQIQLLYGETIDQYSLGLQSFLSKSSQHLKHVKSIVQEINTLYDEISLKYKQLSDVFIVMSSESCSFSEEQCYPKLTETYSQISSLIGQHSIFCMEEKDFIETFMHSHFAYEKDRIDNMQNLISKRKTYITEYSKPKHQNSGKTEQSGSMFSKISGFFGDKSQAVDTPSNNTQILKEQVGFFNSQLMKESIRCVQGMINSHIDHFSMYGHSRIDNVDNMQKIWSTVLVELSKLNMK